MVAPDHVCAAAGRLDDDGRCGALDSAAFSEIFEQYRHAEYLADWHHAVARYGVADAGMHLPRTDAQRSWDAMMRIANDAVSTPPGAQPPEPVVNLACDLDTIEAFLADVPEGYYPPERLTKVLERVRAQDVEGVVIFSSGGISSAKLWTAVGEFFGR